MTKKEVTKSTKSLSNLPLPLTPRRTPTLERQQPKRTNIISTMTRNRQISATLTMASRRTANQQKRQLSTLNNLIMTAACSTEDRLVRLKVKL